MSTTSSTQTPEPAAEPTASDVYRRLMFKFLQICGVTKIVGSYYGSGDSFDNVDTHATVKSDRILVGVAHDRIAHGESLDEKLITLQQASNTVNDHDRCVVQDLCKKLLSEGEIDPNYQHPRFTNAAYYQKIYDWSLLNRFGDVTDPKDSTVVTTTTFGDMKAWLDNHHLTEISANSGPDGESQNEMAQIIIDAAITVRRAMAENTVLTQLCVEALKCELQKVRETTQDYDRDSEQAQTMMSDMIHEAIKTVAERYDPIGNCLVALSHMNIRHISTHTSNKHLFTWYQIDGLKLDDRDHYPDEPLYHHQRNDVIKKVFLELSTQISERIQCLDQIFDHSVGESIMVFLEQNGAATNFNDDGSSGEFEIDLNDLTIEYTTGYYVSERIDDQGTSSPEPVEL